MLTVKDSKSRVGGIHVHIHMLSRYLKTVPTLNAPNNGELEIDETLEIGTSFFGRK